MEKLIFDFTSEENLSFFDDTISAVYDKESGVSIIATDLKPKFDITSKLQKISTPTPGQSYSFRFHTEDIFQLKDHESVKVTFKNLSVDDIQTAHVSLISTSIGDVYLKNGSIVFSIGELRNIEIPLGNCEKISHSDLSILFTKDELFVLVNRELITTKIGERKLPDEQTYDSIAIVGFLGTTNRDVFLSSIEVDGNGIQLPNEKKYIDVVAELSKILSDEIKKTTKGIDAEHETLKIIQEELSKTSQDQITFEKAREAVESFKKESDNMEMTREQSIKLAHELLESIQISPLSVKDLGPEELEKSLYKAMDGDVRYQNASHQELLKEASYLTYILLNEREKKSCSYQIPVGKSYRTYEFGRVDSNTDPSKILFLVMEYPEVWKGRIEKI